MKLHCVFILVWLPAAVSGARATILYSEGFDAEATAKVKIQQQSDTGIVATGTSTTRAITGIPATTTERYYQVRRASGL